MASFLCNCGKRVKAIRYINGKKTCQYCDTKKLSGQWERRILNERLQHEKDILQPSNKHFKEAYGEGRNIK